MKISKARLQQIIKEEVENHLRETEGVLEFDEKALQDASGEMEEGLEGVMSLIKSKGKEGAVKALKGKKEIDNPWALVNAALAKMGRKGLSAKESMEEGVAKNHLQHLATGKKDPNCPVCSGDYDLDEQESSTKEDQLHKKDSKEVIPAKTQIRVELKNC